MMFLLNIYIQLKFNLTFQWPTSFTLIYSSNVNDRFSDRFSYGKTNWSAVIVRYDRLWSTKVSNNPCVSQSLIYPPCFHSEKNPETWVQVQKFKVLACSCSDSCGVSIWESDGAAGSLAVLTVVPQSSVVHCVAGPLLRQPRPAETRTWCFQLIYAGLCFLSAVGGAEILTWRSLWWDWSSGSFVSLGLEWGWSLVCCLSLELHRPGAWSHGDRGEDLKERYLYFSFWFLEV